MRYKNKISITGLETAGIDDSKEELLTLKIKGL
jgi:hypothetical protein